MRLDFDASTEVGDCYDARSIIEGAEGGRRRDVIKIRDRGDESVVTEKHVEELIETKDGNMEAQLEERGWNEEDDGKENEKRKFADGYRGSWGSYRDR